MEPVEFVWTGSSYPCDGTGSTGFGSESVGGQDREREREWDIVSV